MKIGKSFGEYRKSLNFLLFILSCVIVASPAYSEENNNVRIIKTSGVATILNDNIEAGKKEAILSSMRNAVEQVGEQVIPETVVENFELVKDRIIPKAGNYIRNYNILREERQGKNYTVEIEAEVRKKAIADDAAAIYHEMKKPRIMVIIPEIRGMEVVPAVHAENAVSEFFMEKEFTLIDQATAKENIRKDEMRKIAEGDEKAAAKVGLRAGAEVVVVGTATLGDVKNVREVIYASKAAVSIRAIRTDNASLYAISNEAKSAADGIADAAQRKALEITSRSAAKDIFWKIVRKWNDELMIGADIEVIVSGVNFSTLQDVINSLKEIDGVSAVIQRSFDSPTAVLSVTFKGDSIRLAENLAKKKFDEISVEVLSVSTGKFNIRVKCRSC